MRTTKSKFRYRKGDSFKSLRSFCHNSSLLRNLAIKIVENYYKETGSYLGYRKLYNKIKHTKEYKSLNSNIAQNTLRELDSNYKSFFALLKLKQEGKYDKKIFKPRKDYSKKYRVLYINKSQISFNKDTRTFRLPAQAGYYKNHDPIIINVPKCIDFSKVRQVQIVPKFEGSFFAVHFISDAQIEVEEKTDNNYLSLDPGINNLLTAVDTYGNSFIIDGRFIKSKNTFFNKKRKEITVMKKKQNHEHKTKKEILIERKRENQIKDYFEKASKYIVDYCLKNNISTIVMGCNENFQQSSNIGKKNNRDFSFLPLGQLRKSLQWRCEDIGINFIEQEESYTSKSSFFDNDILPKYIKHKDRDKSYVKPSFLGKRIHRGMYKTNNGYILNADVNGALNIMKKYAINKSKAVLLNKLEELRHKGCVNQPIRIRSFNKDKLLNI